MQLKTMLLMLDLQASIYDESQILHWNNQEIEQNHIWYSSRNSK